MSIPRERVLLRSEWFRGVASVAQICPGGAELQSQERRNAYKDQANQHEAS